MTADEYSFGWEYRARATELQDIAAMDRLAAELAPASALSRVGAGRGRRVPAWRRAWGRLAHGGVGAGGAAG